MRFRKSRYPISEQWLYRKRKPSRVSKVLRVGADTLGNCWGALMNARSYAFTRGWLDRDVSNVPVISIGGLTVGGAGKTPIAQWCAQQVSRLHGAVALVLRGYGRKRRGFKMLPTERRSRLPDWESVGDEAWMLAHNLQATDDAGRVVVAVGENRADAISQVCEARPDIRAAVLDDGFQHQGLRRDLDIVVVPPQLASYQMLPAGPLREPVSALRRADLLWVHTGDGTLPTPTMMLAGRRPDILTSYRFVGLTHPDVPRRLTDDDRDMPIALISAVARNANVRNLLESSGVEVALHVALRDHRPIPMAALTRIACSPWPLVTTEKDWPRLMAALHKHPLRDVIWPRLRVIRIGLRFLRGHNFLFEHLQGVCPQPHFGGV